MSTTTSQVELNKPSETYFIWMDMRPTRKNGQNLERKPFKIRRVEASKVMKIQWVGRHCIYIYIEHLLIKSRPSKIHGNLFIWRWGRPTKMGGEMSMIWSILEGYDKLRPSPQLPWDRVLGWHPEWDRTRVLSSSITREPALYPYPKKFSKSPESSFDRCKVPKLPNISGFSFSMQAYLRRRHYYYFETRSSPKGKIRIKDQNQNQKKQMKYKLTKTKFDLGHSTRWSNLERNGPLYEEMTKR